MRLGIDLDNTIVCYDELFRTLALERGLIPDSLPATKRAIRDHLRASGNEPAWTELQGLAYGPRMAEALPFPGALEFLRTLQAADHAWWIISHRSPQPYAGPPYDLHAAARDWLLHHGILTATTLERLQLATTRGDKLARIANCGCDTFIDDLPELLADPAFPPGVRRLLFDPAEETADHPAFERTRNWSEIRDLLREFQAAAPAPPEALPPPPPTLSAQAKEQITAIVNAHEGSADSAGTLLVQSCPGGGNNRAFRVSRRQREYLVKWYFSSPNDRRDRLGAEWSFTTFAWNHGIRAVPQPIGCAPAERLTVLEFIHGRRLTDHEISGTRVAEAGRFLANLQAFRDEPAARQLPIASEACFSYAEQVQCVMSRVERLVERPDGESDSSIHRFVHDELLPAAHLTVEGLRTAVGRRGEPWDVPIPAHARIVSPSDFGFHNALCDEQGTLRFLDFEYAGWDDPAKTVCDFFLQVAVPVARKYWQELVGQLEAAVGQPVHPRAELLFPLYHVKWCCILLNPWLRAGHERVRFSGAGDQRDLLARRLDSARKILASWKELNSDTT